MLRYLLDRTKKMEKKRNNAESIKQKLLNIAKKWDKDFNMVLLQYFHERFLFRLSRSPYKKNFILKGALLLLSKDIFKARPTKDIDFLAVGVSNDKDNIKSIIQSIISVSDDDCVDFLNDSINVNTIMEGADYEGLQIKLNATLGNIERSISIDIGFGDVIVNQLENIDYPVLLNLEPPKIKGYPLETVIAEKLQAMVFLNYQNSRMKDFYDLLYISQNFNFIKKTLIESIKATFNARSTDINNLKSIFSNDFKTDKNMDIRWTSYLKKNKISDVLTFNELINKLEQFFEILTNENTIKTFWESKEYKWIKS